MARYPPARLGVNDTSNIALAPSQSVRGRSVGTEKAVGLMAGAQWDTALLEDLSQAMVDASICGLGQAAPNPLRCVVKYFPSEIA